MVKPLFKRPPSLTENNIVTALKRIFTLNYISQLICVEFQLNKTLVVSDSIYIYLSIGYANRRMNEIFVWMPERYLWFY